MRIRIEETGMFVGPVGASVARIARPTPREQLEQRAIAVMRGKGHEIAVVGGWRDSEVAGVCVFTDLDPHAVTVDILECVSQLHQAGAAQAIAIHSHTQGTGEGAGWPSRLDVDCLVRLRLALQEVGVDLIDSLILTPSGEVVSIQRLEEDAHYRAGVERQFREILDARLQRIDDERVIDRRLRHIDGSVRRLEALAAGGIEGRGMCAQPRAAAGMRTTYGGIPPYAR